jgi:hypothetical protein
VDEQRAHRYRHLCNQSERRRPWSRRARRVLYRRRRRDAGTDGSCRRSLAYSFDGRAFTAADFRARGRYADRRAEANRSCSSSSTQRRTDVCQLRRARRLSAGHSSSVDAATAELHHPLARLHHRERTRRGGALDWRELENRKDLHSGWQPHAARHLQRYGEAGDRGVGRQAFAVRTRESRSHPVHRRRSPGRSEPDVHVAVEWRDERVVVHG